ncbi:MAG: HIT family hydrolase [Desulfobulbus propionicus]|nr:MAG: HIT family hydrolase [Desulfobulbus propionicus]
MKTLWTPWRMEHILGKYPQELECIFEPPGKGAYDKKYLMLHRSQFTVVLLNRFPYANGHLLLAPARHVADLAELDQQEQLRLMGMLSHCCSILRQVLHPDGLNVGLNLGHHAGAGIADHLHFHIVPRWEADHNFMTVCAEVRTIPEHIDTTFDKLLSHFQQLNT